MAGVIEKSRRRALLEQIPPRKCKAMSVRSGQPCKHWAMVGHDVCQTHGGRSRQAKAAAERRMTLAEALKTAPRRHPWEVLEDALHVADLLMREARVAVEDGRVTPTLVDKMVAALERAHRLAKVNLDAGIDQRRQSLAETQANQMHKVFTRVLSGLDLTAEQRAKVPDLLRREIQGVLAIEASTP